MFRGCKLRQKEVINITTAERLGYVSDVEISEKTGTIEAIIVPRRGCFFRRIIGGGELIIPWNHIAVSERARSSTHARPTKATR